MLSEQEVDRAAIAAYSRYRELSPNRRIETVEWVYLNEHDRNDWRDSAQAAVEAVLAQRTEPAPAQEQLGRDRTDEWESHMDAQKQAAQSVPQSALLRAAKWNRITWPCDRSDFLAWRPREDGVGIEVLIYNYANRQLPSGDGLFYVADASSLMAIGRDEPVPQSAGDNSSGAEQINVPQCTAPAPAQEQQREGIDGYTRTTVGEDGFHREYIFVPNPQPVPQSVGTEGTLTHGRCCSSGFDLDADCTCGLQWRIQLQTEQEMHNAWRKRAEEAEAACAEETRQFKNFHRNLCERFNYCHDEIDWKRDQASLEEHIAEARKGLHSEAEIEKALQDEVEQWPGYESWYKCFTKDVLARLNAHKEERVTVEKEMR